MASFPGQQCQSTEGQCQYMLTVDRDRIQGGIFMTKLLAAYSPEYGTAIQNITTSQYWETCAKLWEKFLKIKFQQQSLASTPRTKHTTETMETVSTAFPQPDWHQLCELMIFSSLITWGPFYKIYYDLSQDYRKFIVKSTYDSDLKCVKNFSHEYRQLIFTNTVSDELIILRVNHILHPS